MWWEALCGSSITLDLSIQMLHPNNIPQLQYEYCVYYQGSPSDLLPITELAQLSGVLNSPLAVGGHRAFLHLLHEAAQLTTSASALQL